MAASSSADPSTPITLAALIDRYMVAYTGRDPARQWRLRWWMQQLGAHPAASITDQQVAEALERLRTRPGRVYAGRDADGKAIHRAKRATLAPATLNGYLVKLA